MRDDLPRSVRTIAAEVGFHDPMHRGELARLFDGAGRRRKYLRRSGVTLDAFAEILWDRRLTVDRLDVQAVYALLDTAFDATVAPRKRRKVAKRSAVRAIESEAVRAKRNRLRKSVCVECAAIGYSSAIVQLEHCGRPMLRIDPTFREVMNQVSAAECAPF